jgi:hypothetical protein
MCCPKLNQADRSSQTYALSQAKPRRRRSSSSSSSSTSSRSSDNGWRRVIFDDATDASHRPGQLHVVVNTPVPCSLPVGTCVRLRVPRTRTGHVLSSNKNWRRVSFDDKREANHRVNELEETQLQIEANGARPIKRLRGKQPLQSSTAVVTYSEPGNAPPLTFLPIRQQASVGTSLPDIQVVPHYAMLRITPGACAEEVRGAYLRRALMTHPDKRLGRG